MSQYVRERVTNLRVAMFGRRRSEVDSHPGATAGRAAPGHAAGRHVGLLDSYFDEALGEEVAYRVRRPGLGLVSPRRRASS